ANISFIGQAGRVFPKRVVEICEVWQIRDVLHQRVDPCREGALYDASTFRKPFVNSLRDLDQHLYQMCDVTAGVVDVGLQQHAITGSLVELNVIIRGKHVFELRAVEASRSAY